MPLKITTIQITPETRDRLAYYCSKRETYDQAINRMLDELTNKKDGN